LRVKCASPLNQQMAKEPIIPASLQRRLELYGKAAELHAQGFSNGEIAKMLGTGAEQVRRWMRGEKPKRVHRYEPDLTPSRDLAYVAGFYLGDGKRAGKENKVRFELGDQQQIEHVGLLVAGILHREPKPWAKDRSFYVISYDSVALYEFLNRPVEKLVDYLGKFTRDFLRGFFDAEGYCTCSLDFQLRKLRSVTVGIANTKIQSLKTMARILVDLGLPCSFRRTNRRGGKMTIAGRTWTRRRDVYHISVTGFDQVKRFRDEVGFWNPQKANKLADLVALGKMPPGERYSWFVTHYTKRGRKWVRKEK